MTAKVDNQVVFLDPSEKENPAKAGQRVRAELQRENTQLQQRQQRLQQLLKSFPNAASNIESLIERSRALHDKEGVPVALSPEDAAAAKNKSGLDTLSWDEFEKNCRLLLDESLRTIRTQLNVSYFLSFACCGHSLAITAYIIFCLLFIYF